MTSYNPNHKFWIDQERARAEQTMARAQSKMAELDLRQQIADIDEKLKILNIMQSLYPPHRADDAQPSALDITPASPS